MALTRFAHRVARTLLPSAVEDFVRSVHYRHSLDHLEPEEDALACRQFVHPGDTVLDVGANVGTYSRFFSNLGCVVHALEPVPSTFRYLAANAGKNVFCYNVAASNRNGMASMKMPEYTDGGPNHHRAEISKEGNIAVRTITLDTLCDGLNPTLIKVDVEGHEIPVILGATKLVERCRPAWLIEVSSDETIALMSTLGYEARKGSEPNWFFVSKTGSFAGV